MRARRRKVSAGKFGKRGMIGGSAGAVILLLLLWAAQSLGILDTGESTRPAGGSVQSLSGQNAEGKLQVWYADIGQGDCELIQTPQGTNILIDAGDTYAGDALVQWLKDRGIQKLDIIIATHPHADHIGGMTDVLEAFPPEKFYMPQVADEQTPTTRVYESMLDKLAEQGKKISRARAGTMVLEEEGLTLEFLAPVSEEYDDLNNYSAVTRLTYGERTFLFTGDAEREVEKELLESGVNLQADVLKCGHHGSSTSTSASFLKAVAPGGAVISCGEDNDYGHPHQETLDRLEKAGVQIYRTDTQGTIRVLTDGKSLVWETGLPSAWEE